MTIPALAEATKISASTIGRIEKDRRDSELTFLLEEYLGIVPVETDDHAGSEAPQSVLTAEDAARHLPNTILIAEVARRFAQLPGNGSATGVEGEDFTWPTALGPHGYGQTGQSDTPEVTESSSKNA